MLPVVHSRIVTHLRQLEQTISEANHHTATSHQNKVGQDESVAYTGVTTESDDMFALDSMESLDLQKPL